MKGKKKKMMSMTDPDNILGKDYAGVLKERAMLLRSSLLLSAKVREQIAFDLDALGQVALLHPEVFGVLK